jgi:glycosyltransferase involved in cell wall biosynthesis
VGTADAPAGLSVPGSDATAPGGDPARTRVLRIIARMNVGGPAKHVALLSGRLDPDRYETLLVCGHLGRGEASYEHLAAEHGARVARLGALRPEIAPADDARALVQIRAAMRRFRPEIVHTHTAKAGFLGRLAARLHSPRPIVVHTYHGHVLEHYFGPAKTAVYRGLERSLAHVSDRLVGVSRATVEDLVRLRVADRSKLVHIALGLELDPFLAVGREDAAAVRAELAVGPGDVLATSVGRLVPIKRLDLALRAVAAARAAGAPVVLALAGDGEERAALESLAAELRIAGYVRFLGFRDDAPSLAAAADVALLSSDNEGTPVALIEAAAAGTPAIATRVGGVDEVVVPGAGEIVPPRDVAALAAALRRMAGLEPAARERLGDTARRHVSARFTSERLLGDIDGLYSELVASRAAGRG